MNDLSTYSDHHFNEPQERETNLSACSDAQLWDAFRSGSKQAFDTIYDTYFQPLCSYGDRICDNPSLVEDVIQDLFIYLWTKKENLGKTDTIRFYLFRCLRRKLIRALSQEKRKPDPFSNVEKEHYHFPIALKQFSITSAEDEEMRRQLALALNRLTDRQKEAIYLKFYNNLSFQEVASIMEVEVRSIYNLLSRTIDVLRKDLSRKEISSTLLISFISSLLLYTLR